MKDLKITTSIYDPILTLIWIAGAAIVAGIIVLFFRRNQIWHEKIRSIKRNL